MISDWFVTVAGRKGFSVDIHPVGKGTFEVSSSNARTMVSLLLRRQRQKSGLSLAQAAQRLGAKSRNAYARYERGASVPTVEKLDELYEPWHRAATSSYSRVQRVARRVGVRSL